MGGGGVYERMRSMWQVDECDGTQRNLCSSFAPLQSAIETSTQGGTRRGERHNTRTNRTNEIAWIVSRIVLCHFLTQLLSSLLPPLPLPSAQLARSRKRVPGPGTGAVDLTSTLSKYGYATGFDVTKHIEEFYSHHPISSSLEQRDELRTRRELVSEALKAYVTNHYQSFISTSSEITTIENDMLKLNNLLGQFQVGLKVLSSPLLSFTYEDEKYGFKLKQIEKSSGVAAGEGFLGSNASSAETGGQHPADFELEELNEELRGYIYERKFDSAIGTLHIAMEKSRKRARELAKEKDSSGSMSPVVVGGDDSSLASFRAISSDLLDLRATLVEMLFSELRAAATSSSVIGGKAGGPGPSSKGGKRGGGSGGGGGGGSSGGPTGAGSVPALQHLITHLVTLKQTKRTCSIFLYHVKSTHLRASIRGIKFSGDILSYIQELSKKFFGGLGQTVGEFHRLFLYRQNQNEMNNGGGNIMMSSTSSSNDKFVPNPASLSSYLVRWILHETYHTFHTIFQRQVFQMEGTFSKLGKCLKIAFIGAQEFLQERFSVGITLSFVLAKMFLPSLQEVITKNYKHVENLIHEELNVEAWRVTELLVNEKDRGGGGGVDGSQSIRSRKASSATLPSGGTSLGGVGPPKKKLALRLTSSAKYLYDVVRNLLRELVPILDNSSYPEMKNELYPVVVSGMISLFEGYLLAMAQKLKNGLYEFEEIQALSIVANSFYLHSDLLPRVIKEFRKHFGGTGSGSGGGGGGGGGASSSSSSSSNIGIVVTIPELELFNQKLKRLYEALRDSFASKRACILWPNEQYLKFSTKLVGGSNKYANPLSLTMSGDLIHITSEWLDFVELTLVSFKTNVSRTLPPGDEVERVVMRALGDFLEGVSEGSWRNASSSTSKDGGNTNTSSNSGINTTGGGSSGTGSNGGGSFWSTYLFGLGGLQQFILDFKYFAMSCGATNSTSSSSSNSLIEVGPGGFFNERCSTSCNLLLKMSIESYASKTGTRTNREWFDTNLKWIDGIILKRLQNMKVNNLGKMFQADKEKVTFYTTSYTHTHSCAY